MTLGMFFYSLGLSFLMRKKKEVIVEDEVIVKIRKINTHGLLEQF